MYLYGEDGVIADALHAIATAFKRIHPTKRFIWKSGEEFTHDMIMAIKDDKMDSFRKMYRKCDLLIVDRIETIAGKQSTMKEFYELFDHVYINGGKIVVAGRTPPSKIYGLDDRIRTQFEGGIIHNITI